MNYANYRFILSTKTAADISNGVRATNNWRFTTSNLTSTVTPQPNVTYPVDGSGTLIGVPTRVSTLIYNNAAFLSGNTTLPITYTFYIDGAVGSTPAVYGGINTVRRAFDVSLVDPTLPNGQSSAVAKKFGGPEDVARVDLSWNDFRLTTVSLSSLNAGTNNTINATLQANGYIVEHWVSQSTYCAQINPSLPFYDNLLLKSPPIREENIYYRIWSATRSSPTAPLVKGIELTNTDILQNIFNTSTGQPLSNVQAALVSSFSSPGNNNIANSSTSIQLKPSDCCIFKVGLTGLDLSSNQWKGVGYYDVSQLLQITSHLDPFTVHSSTLSLPNITTANLTVSLTSAVLGKEYYLDVAKDLGSSITYTATMYKIPLDMLASLDLSFNPYLTNFTGFSQYAKQTQYVCDISNAGSQYILNVRHTNNNLTYTDVTIRFEKNYVLNFNVINSSSNLLRVIRKLGRSSSDITDTRTSYIYATNQTNAQQVLIDNGVYFKHRADVKYGLRDVFNLQPDRIRIAHVNHQNYKFNDPYWCDVSGNRKPVQYPSGLPSGQTHFSVFSNNSDPNLNGTKSVKVHRVRGFGVKSLNDNVNIPGTGRVDINRVPASFTFTLDASSGYFQPIGHYVADICRNIFVAGPTYWTDASSANPGVDGSFNFINDLSFNYYVDNSGTRVTLTNFPNSNKRTSNRRNSIFILDASNSFIRRIPTLVDICGNVIPGSVSPKDPTKTTLGVYDSSLVLLDPSYNYTAEQMVYSVTIQAGCGSFVIGNAESQDGNSYPLKSVNDVTPVNGVWKINTVTNNRVYLDTGLVLKVNESVFPDTTPPVNYAVQANSADYKYEFANPPNASRTIVKGTGIGLLNEGIIIPFFKFRSRSMVAKDIYTVELNFTNSSAHVYFSPKYTGDPTISNSPGFTFTELSTSPFYPEELDAGTGGISLHPTVRGNPDWNVKLAQSSGNIEDNKTSYFICAPPAYKVEYNRYDQARSLPFNNTNLSKVTKYIDMSNSNPFIDLRMIDNGSVGNRVVLQPTEPIDLYNMKTLPNEGPHNFNIQGNNITIKLYQGVGAAPGDKVFYYFDNSLNMIDPSGTHQRVRDDIDVSYGVWYTTQTGALLDTLYSGPIDDIVNSPKLRVKHVNGTPLAPVQPVNFTYDISFQQPLNGIVGVDMSRNNVRFVIDNAFLPPSTANLSLQTATGTSVVFYESVVGYENGQYTVFLNKYSNAGSDGKTPVNYNYNSLFTQNPNVREIGFLVNKVEQFKLPLPRAADVSFSYNIPEILQTIRPIDLSNVTWTNITRQALPGPKVEIVPGIWIDDSAAGPDNLGISYTAHDQLGIAALKNIFTYNASDNLLTKTLYVERDDIFRVFNFFGRPIFRITNSGNVVSNILNSTRLNLFTPAVGPVTVSADANSTDKGVLISLANPGTNVSQIFEGTVDFSGNLTRRYDFSGNINSSI